MSSASPPPQPRKKMRGGEDSGGSSESGSDSESSSSSSSSDGSRASDAGGERRQRRQQQQQRRGESEDEDEVVGPLPPVPPGGRDGGDEGGGDTATLPPPKRRRKLEFEKVYLEDLATCDRYEKSFMHRDVVTQCVVCRGGFVATCSVDGHVKFWKKDEMGVEFVKHFRAHLANVQDVAVNSTGSLLVTVSKDKLGKVFDVQNFDMINILKFRRGEAEQAGADGEEDLVPECCEWVHQPGDLVHALAVAFSESKVVRIYDGKGPTDQAPLFVLDKLHTKPVCAISYNAVLDVALSADRAGMIEYWLGPKEDCRVPQPTPGRRRAAASVVTFRSKLDTDLFELAKHKTHALSLSVSPSDGELFAVYGADRRIRIFKFRSGRLYCSIDESLEHYAQLQQQQQQQQQLQDPQGRPDQQQMGSRQLFNSMDFNRKVSTEKDLEKNEAFFRLSNVVFDKTGNFIYYPCMAGVKLVNIVTKRTVGVIGSSENLRLINVALSHASDPIITAGQGGSGAAAGGGSAVSSGPQSIEMHVSENPALQNRPKAVPILFCTAYKKNRFYLFTKRSSGSSPVKDGGGQSSSDSRDVYNEKPSQEERLAASSSAEDSGLSGNAASSARLYESATIHTTMGDVAVKLFARECPKTVENFCVHAKNNYFNGCLFHRVIKQFMVQTGDPTGNGTGGQSIWGRDFADEFNPKLRHDRPYTLSMANAGPNTNGSQFFVTVVPTPWLDNKHTVFGRVTRGMDVILALSNVKTHPKNDKPYDEVSIISVTVRDPVK